jgi:hypothetical protein
MPGRWSVEAKRRQGERIRALWGDPEFRERRTREIRESWTPERRAAAALRLREINKLNPWKPERRAALSAKMKLVGKPGRGKPGHGGDPLMLTRGVWEWHAWSQAARLLDDYSGGA